MFVNLNLVSDRLSQKERTGCRLLSFTKASAIPNRMLKTTICRTCPSATDFAIFSGNMWRMMSDALCGNAGPIIADVRPDNHGGENPSCQRFSPPRITDKYHDDDPANDGHDLMLGLSAGTFLR